MFVLIRQELELLIQQSTQRLFNDDFVDPQNEEKSNLINTISTAPMLTGSSRMETTTTTTTQEISDEDILVESTTPFVSGFIHDFCLL